MMVNKPLCGSGVNLPTYLDVEYYMQSVDAVIFYVSPTTTIAWSSGSNCIFVAIKKEIKCA
jgi:hypothetical protein